jgi:hypothetical protein
VVNHLHNLILNGLLCIQKLPCGIENLISKSDADYLESIGFSGFRLAQLTDETFIREYFFNWYNLIEECAAK